MPRTLPKEKEDAGRFEGVENERGWIEHLVLKMSWTSTEILHTPTRREHNLAHGRKLLKMFSGIPTIPKNLPWNFQRETSDFKMFQPYFEESLDNDPHVGKFRKYSIN